jgi:DNA-binding CsgD family transcriptional regulator
MGRQEQPDQSETIYQLYEHAALQGPSQYRGLATELCARQIAFDAVFWGIRHHETPVPTSLWRQRVRNSFLAELEPPEWEAFEQALFEDAVTTGAARLAVLNIARGGLGRLPALRGHFREAGIAQVLALRSPHDGRPMQSLILFLRREGRPAFGADELASLTPLAPHLGGGLTLALRSLANVDHLLQSLGRPSRHSTGVLDDRGMLLEADDKFRALLHTHFPDWRGGHLPFPLPPLDRAGVEEPVVAGLHVRGSRGEGMTVVHLREVNPMDLLSPRERDVVRAIASGLTLKSIGKRLDISPSTVANHAARIYAKLGIHSRDRLVEMLKLLNSRHPEGQQGRDDKAS